MSRLLIIVLALAAVAIAVPLPASKLQQSERNVRQTDPSLQGEIENISAPAYIKDLFKNITNERHEQNKATSNDDLVNAVRSFPNLVAGHCGKLGFNISIINPSEFVVKAELRVRVDRARDAKAVLLHTNGTRITHQQVTSDWIEFSMNTFVANWARQERHKQHEFTIELLDSNNERLSCEGRIMTESEDRDQQPLLVVYSIEPNYEDLPIIKGIRRMMNQTTDSRKRRSTTVTSTNFVKVSGSCRKHNVEEVTAEWLNNNVGTDEGTIIGPTKFQVGVCGGNCSRTVPVAPAHAIMFHLMATSSSARQAHLSSPEQFTRCCVPLEYNDITFIMEKGEGKSRVFSMWKLKQAQVTKCGCIYYKHQTPAPTTS